MKGVDAIGPLLEPTTTQATEGQPAKTKDGKQFDALLAEAVEPSKSKAVKLPRGDVLKAELVADTSALVTARSIHSAIQGEGEVAELEGEAAIEDTKIEDAKIQDAKLEEPKTAPQDQLVLQQVASVVARIVAPAPPPQQTAQAPKVEVTKAAETAAPANTLPSPPPSNDVALPAHSQEFQDALNAFDLMQSEVHEAQTLRPGASESLTPPSAPHEEPRGPIGRALQALTGENAPIRAAADKVMTAFRALSGRDQMPTVPAPAPTMMQVVKGASPAIPPPAAHQAELAPNPLAGSALAAQVSRPTLSGPEMPTVRPEAQLTTSPPLQIPQGPRVPSSQVQLTAQGKIAVPVQTAPSPRLQNVQTPNVLPSVPPTLVQTAGSQPGVVVEQPAQPDEAASAPLQPQGKLAAQQPTNVQATIIPQAENSNAVATQPVVVQMEQPVVEEAAREQSAEKNEPASEREQVHGFTRGGWTGSARSAYGGRGHESGERSSSERGETARTFKREEERATERTGDTTPQFVQEQLRLPEQQLQAPVPAQEARPQNVPQNQPAAAPAPVQELPDIVFQGRPADPTAATENATISLHHPDLGPIQLEVHRELGRVEVHAVIESHHAQAVLRANESGIRQGVQQAGMTFNALRVRVRGEEQPTNRPGQERRRRENQREK